MEIPTEFIGRVCKTKIGPLSAHRRKLDQIIEQYSNVEMDVIYEKATPIIVLVFENTEDCLAFKLKYGEEYV